MRLRRLRMGLSTLLGGPAQGWFIPYRYAAGLPAAGRRQPYDAIEAMFRAREPAFLALIDEIEAHADALSAIGSEPAPAPRWQQSWFPRLDAAAAYAMLRRERPARVIEVGSGHSTRFLARAVRDGGLATAILAIDPAPRAAIAALPVERLAMTVQQAGVAPFAALAAGDVLFIDSSHILMPGSDVDLLFGRVLPALPPGVLVHVHDVFLPDDYPPSWDWRGYNEQLGVLGLLQGGAWRVEFASRYVATRLASRLRQGVLARLPLPEEAFEASLWLRKQPAG